MTKYKYHSTVAKNLPSIYEKGLLPSERGQFGKGVYFSDTSEQALKWGRELRGDVQNKILRVKSSFLMKNGYVDYDDEQGIINKKIPSENIEILGNDGKWTTLNDYAHKYYRSFGISRDDVSSTRGIGSTSTSRT